MIRQFLEQSNNIEGIFDEDSLQQALYAWEYLKRRMELSASVILEAHRILMLHHLPQIERGHFRRVGVRIGADYGIRWQLVGTAMHQWCKDIKSSKTAEEIRQGHIAFETIHPFIDGNGRIGRLLLNWQRRQNNLPILVIKNSEKQSYYNWFHEKNKV